MDPYQVNGWPGSCYPMNPPYHDESQPSQPQGFLDSMCLIPPTYSNTHSGIGWQPSFGFVEDQRIWTVASQFPPPPAYYPLNPMYPTQQPPPPSSTIVAQPLSLRRSKRLRESNAIAGRRRRESARRLSQNTSPSARLESRANNLSPSAELELEVPLSELVMQVSDVTDVDIAEHINRSLEDRRYEQRQGLPTFRKLRVTFWLYYQGHKNRVRALIDRGIIPTPPDLKCHQVKKVIGANWPLETREVREQYREFAQMEYEGHLRANPNFEMPRQGRLRNKNLGREEASVTDSISYEDDLDDEE
ncbi:hypothetical protein F4821DRAFT_281394 [Hypoxylon rubiginosum]|uniref:Uncharacterized protein n=1 Tax=Hypoxylon rubiginosum TaxID=110542 RepID=A0ACC0CRD7_9PEZI|nr:hypothetical protein F4821DRAFT_281394 [Hypoxylon rubiginosum]